MDNLLIHRQIHPLSRSLNVRHRTNKVRFRTPFVKKLYVHLWSEGTLSSLDEFGMLENTSSIELTGSSGILDSCGDKIGLTLSDKFISLQI